MKRALRSITKDWLRLQPYVIVLTLRYYCYSIHLTNSYSPYYCFIILIVIDIIILIVIDIIILLLSIDSMLYL